MLTARPDLPAASHSIPQPLSSAQHTQTTWSVLSEQVLRPLKKPQGLSVNISIEKLTPHPPSWLSSLWELIHKAAPQPFALFLPSCPFAVALGSSSTYPVSLSVFHTSWERRERAKSRAG